MFKIKSIIENNI